MKKIALLSPSQDAFSETFIQVHKNLLNAEVLYFYYGIPPEYIEGVGRINPLWMKIPNYIIGKIIGNNIYDEQVALKKALRKYKVDLVFAEYGTMGNAVVKICKELKLPLITHFHGADISKYDCLSKNNYYKDVFSYSKKIISVSSVMTKKMIDLGCPSHKIVYTPCAANDKFQAISPTLSKKELLFVGRFVEKKAPDTLIKAFSLALNKEPEAKLIMVGDGPLKEACISLVKQLNIKERVEFKGILEQKKIISLMKTARAYVQHSVTGENGDQEGTPVSVSEASMAGLPVISTIHGGIQDIILHEETGLLTKELDIEQTSKNMVRVLSDINLAKNMGARGKKRMIKNFSMTDHITKLNNAIYE